jgi:hypothetical protein
MSTRREDLLREEAEGWTALNDLLGRLGRQERSRPGLNAEGWTVVDLLWHVEKWCDEATRVLEQVRAGTWDEAADPSNEPGWTDARNATWLEESRAATLEEAEAAWPVARARMLEAFGALEAPSAAAEEWFEESGPRHYAEHDPDLRAWAARVASS